MTDVPKKGKTALVLNPYKEDRSQPSLRHGGNLEGIRQHLDYFNELGVTALWFTPVLENNSPDTDNGFSTYHGYATTDYYRVDPRFGTNAQYRQLIADAHAHGLKVVMDMIFNHCGFEHPWVSDMPTADWFNLPQWLKESEGKSNPTGTSFQQTSYKLTPVMDPYASKVDMKETVEGWFVPTMPDLNQKNPHVMKYLIQNSIWWIETVDIDGIRMDTYPYADRAGMAQWMRVLDAEYPNFNTVGETWVTEPAYTAAWQKDSKLSPVNSYLKTVMDFSFFDKLNMAKNEETDAWWNGLNRIYNSFVYDYLYVNPSNVMAFIENHDTDRFLGNGRDTLALKQALALLLTVNIEAYAVGSRTIEKAQAFARQWDIPCAYGSYSELIADPDVDLVYVGTPHSHHFDVTCEALENGKPCLVEKAFMANYRQAQTVVNLSRERKVFVAEAIWTRYQPAVQMVRQLINDGRIGTPRLITATLGYSMGD